MHSHVIKLYIMDIYNFKTKKKNHFIVLWKLYMTNIIILQLLPYISI